MTGTVFDRVADEYDSARPTYPVALYEALERLSGRRLRDAVVVDVGAGTGISTRGLMARGARVLAVELGAAMLARLLSRTADATAVQATGDALPIGDGTVDFVTFAQSWHWLDEIRSLTEARRVLRPGGAVAAWWNHADPDASAWSLSSHHERLAAACPDYCGPASPGWRVAPVADRMRELGFDVAETTLPWIRRIELEAYLTDLRSRSFMAALDRPTVAEIVERERHELGSLFGDGVVIEPFRVYLAVGGNR